MRNSETRGRSCVLELFGTAKSRLEPGGSAGGGGDSLRREWRRSSKREKAKASRAAPWVLGDAVGSGLEGDLQ
ncbi:Hypothetical predicted protein [Podarcis lilfordi]|uniref:Uncharacterized protein n=1 Tax=Podarcis lilfordi TaxID=74358 RepID=A0AA35KPA0_9SAUR|nr:Hypothetical predicted protein [Podarcis lilfordi]